MDLRLIVLCLRCFCLELTEDQGDSSASLTSLDVTRVKTSQRDFQKNVSLCQDVSSAQFFTPENVCSHEYEAANLILTHTHHTHNNCKHSRVWISHFLMSNISLGFHGNRRRGAAVSMPPPPSRRRDRRHPIMNTQITKTVSHPSSFRRLSLSSMSLPRAHHKVLVSARVFLSPLSCVGPNQVNLKLEPLLTADCSV